MTEEEKTLPSDPKLSELFSYYGIEEGGCRVVPLTVNEDPADTQLILLVRGEHQLASVIFSELWSRLNEMTQQAAQQEANRGGAGIITP